jgi:hypothetical protein
MYTKDQVTGPDGNYVPPFQLKVEYWVGMCPVNQRPRILLHEKIFEGNSQIGTLIEPYYSCLEHALQQDHKMVATQVTVGAFPLEEDLFLDYSKPQLYLSKDGIGGFWLYHPRYDFDEAAAEARLVALPILLQACTG